jgi:hypothetical protein
LLAIPYLRKVRPNINLAFINGRKFNVLTRKYTTKKVASKRLCISNIYLVKRSLEEDVKVPLPATIKDEVVYLI